MTDPAVLDFARGRAEQVERSARARFGDRNGHDRDEVARDLEDHVREVLTFPDMLRRAWRSIFHAMFSRRQVDYRSLGERVRDVWRLCAAVMKDVLRVGRETERQAGTAVGELAELEAAIADVERMREAILAEWPWPPMAEEVRQAREATSRGEYLDSEEAFAEIAGLSPEAWRRKVEEHKQKNGSGSGGA
jgi:hypothetical protein